MRRCVAKIDVLHFVSLFYGHGFLEFRVAPFRHSFFRLIKSYGRFYFNEVSEEFVTYWLVHYLLKDAVIVLFLVTFPFLRSYFAYNIKLI